MAIRRAGIRSGTAGPAVQPGIQLLPSTLPFLLMAVVAVVDVWAGPGVGFLPLLSLGPALAAVSLRPARTALVGGLALALCLGLAAFDQVSSGRELIALVSVAGVTAAGVVASAGRQRREGELAKVTAVAEAAQRVLLRPVPPQIGPLQVAVRYISATASARIGGDLYEVIAMADGNVRLIVGDVQGKGLGAVQTAAAVLGAFRENAYDAADLPALAARIELALLRQAAEEEFVTAVLAQVTGSGDIEILNCGHPWPLHLSSSGVRFIGPSTPGLPFGLAGLAVAERGVDTATLRPGERILFYTDGISEARDGAGAFYDLGGCGSLLAGPQPGGALDHLCDDVISHVGHELLDDAAMLLISHSGAAAGPATGEEAREGFAEAGLLRGRPSAGEPPYVSGGGDEEQYHGNG
jgi:Stage II sporulation protein E (SpoIIE)